uniref:Uncharacterized protein n=1 Tax=Candidozyma auris TaxID=498019 RepID=A0A0L0NR84_CANAR
MYEEKSRENGDYRGRQTRFAVGKCTRPINNLQKEWHEAPKQATV